MPRRPSTAGIGNFSGAEARGKGALLNALQKQARGCGALILLTNCMGKPAQSPGLKQFLCLLTVFRGVDA
jgi:hypothetical protein